MQRKASNQQRSGQGFRIHREQLPFKLISFFDSRTLRTRFLIFERKTNIAVKAASVIEEHLQHRHDSQNSVKTHLSHLLYLYTWANEYRYDLDTWLLTGEVLSHPQIRSFASWLKSYLGGNGSTLSHTRKKTFNATLSYCCQTSIWCASQFAQLESSNTQRALDIEALKDAQKSMWKDLKLKVKEDDVAPDLTEEEIEKIEQFLKPENRLKNVSPQIVYRDYLIWRLTIEFGMRIGEVLALRQEDCPSRNAPYFRIVRVEERGPNYRDPRKNPPRPKTLSRDLGILLSNSVFPVLVNEFITEHRFVWKKSKGRKIKQFLLSHDFLIIAKSGAPLSISSIEDISKTISESTGVDFNWHLARHAFFNRAYAAVAQIQDKDHKAAKIQDLVMYGGWSSEKSLEIYTRRARQQRARFALNFWQKGGSPWSALD